jgi:hypothetical protein
MFNAHSIKKSAEYSSCRNNFGDSHHNLEILNNPRWAYQEKIGDRRRNYICNYFSDDPSESIKIYLFLMSSGTRSLLAVSASLGP